jgi:CMP-N-acetylneuraminic acid synthetase
MFERNSLLALVPARSGSKGLLNKNIMDFAGKPLIEWTISAAKSVSFFDDILVSTDSNKIADIAINAGASVPFLRPNELATDSASMLDVVKHAWKNYLAPNGKPFDYIVLLQPTSPLRISTHIFSAVRLFFEKCQSEQDTLASVYEVNKKNGWLMQKEDKNSYINFCFDLNKNNPQRQQLKPFYLPNGAIFIIKGSEIDAGIYHNNTIPFVMDISDSDDIDSMEDFRKAEDVILKK